MGNRPCVYASCVNEEGVFRSTSIQTHSELIDSLPDGKQELKSLFIRSCGQYSGKKFLGKKHSSKKKYVWLTYQEVREYSFSLAKAIIEREFYTRK